MRQIFIYLFSIAALFGIGSSNANFLKPDEAFKPSISAHNGEIEVKIILGKKIYIYKDELSLEVENAKIKKIIYPKTEKLHGVDVFRLSPVVIKAQLGNITSDKIKVALNFQGCSEDGLCYAPITFQKEFKTIFRVTSQHHNITDENKIANILKSQNLFYILILFFGFGLLLSLTPCVFPMIPILSSILVSQGKNLSPRRGFFFHLHMCFL